MRKLKLYIVFPLALWLTFCGMAAAEQLYVNEGGWWRDGGAFNASDAPIQAAVDNATAGDSIYVDSGTYHENVVVNKQLTLRGIDMPVVDACGGVSAVTLDADGITLDGFVTTGSGSFGMFVPEGCVFQNAGIEVMSNHNIITNNTASNNGLNGIELYHSRNNTLRNNLMSDNRYNFVVWGKCYSHFDNDIDTSNLVYGKPIYYFVDASGTVIDSTSNAGTVYCINCENITVKDLTLTNNAIGIYFYNTDNSSVQNNHMSNNCRGIHFDYSCGNTIANNIASNNHGHGIYLDSSYSNTVVTNNASNNKYGICLDYSSNNNVTGNTASNNKGYGIELHGSNTNNNTIINNTASNNGDGIRLHDHCIISRDNSIIGNTVSNNRWDGISIYQSSSSTVTNNIISNNGDDGIYLLRSSNNKIYLNSFINNNANAYSRGSTSIWSSPESITYHYNSSSFTNYMGNYWSDYRGSDANMDGIGNASYSIGLDEDNYPLMERFENYSILAERPAFTTTDAVIALQIAVGSRPSNPRWDVSGDGSVTSLDALMILQAAAGNREDPITGCKDLDQNILRMYDEDGDGRIDEDWVVNAAIDLDESRITQSGYDQVKYAYEHNCPVEPAE